MEVVKSFKKNNLVEFSLVSDNKKIPLISLDDFNHQLIVDYKINDYYLIIYSCGYTTYNSIPTITYAYDLKNNCVLDLTNNEKLRYALEDTLLFATDFSKKVILQSVVNYPLNIVSKEAINEFFHFMKCGNENITDNEVINYLLYQMPILAKYRNIKRSLTPEELYNVCKMIPNKSLNCMPQDLSFLYNELSLSKKKQ